ncbi:AAA family ATPase [Pseudomonas putida]|uniref:AAA family ATPase n=1 Tax=Pseudomonas putida TaxID=303 RepID=UPI00235BDF38|nr:AAA family ATPase [Pseudomonas putida]GLO46543.1 hypothetical protein PPUN109347_31060 [Pseudomonas putida]HDS0979928.1 AAA family ATPase [Pseudomonas putida]
MKVFIESLYFQNRSPFDELEVNFSENEIAVLTAVNGRGKTTILSHIVDAFHEMAKNWFPRSFEGKEDKFYRVTSGLNKLNPSLPSVFYLRLNVGGDLVDYVDVIGDMSEPEYQALMIENKISYNDFSRSLNDSKTVKHWRIDKDKAESIFKSNIVTYFPAYRFETPGYINKPYDINLSFRNEASFAGTLPNPLEVISGLKTFANWLMDIVLDMQYSGSNVVSIKQLLDQVVTLILQGKESSSLRFGIGPRGFGATRIQVINSKTNVGVYPSIFHMSSGEAAALCFVGELIRQADNIVRDSPVSEVTGIVLVDEVDKHLHIRLQKEVLPKLLSLFPNVQFVMSSHSPFMAMGLADEALARSKIVDLDNFGISKDPYNSDLYAEVYEMMTVDSVNFRQQYYQLKEAAEKSSKTLIVTEGKTDIQHLKAATKALARNDSLSFFEVPADWGDSKLEKLLEQLSKLKQSCTVVGVFDRDVDRIVSDVERDGRLFKNYGNNVYGFCLPVPPGREFYSNISIEFYYGDHELKKLHDGKRLHFDNEVCYFQSASANRGKPVPQLRTQPESADESIKKIFDTNVSELSGAHSKARFADLVEGESEFSKDFDFSNFNLVFNRILQIEEYERTKPQ